MSLRNYRKKDAEALESIGLNKFFAAFVTLPAFEMKKVVNFVSLRYSLLTSVPMISECQHGGVERNKVCNCLQACAKHEQQLECGMQYEGEEKTNQRVEELMQDGGNRQMFEHECVEENYATTVYPCLGKTEMWMGACEKEISEYSVLRQKVNGKIESVYNAAIQTVKSMKENREQVFTDTMKFINYAEGSKCLAFKKATDSVLSDTNLWLFRCASAFSNSSFLSVASRLRVLSTLLFPSVIWLRNDQIDCNPTSRRSRIQLIRFVKSCRLSSCSFCTCGVLKVLVDGFQVMKHNSVTNKY